jgi:NAD(P)-dependent dehydrogenase (short-subunit alcohol dehydrogenase family)
MLQLKNTLVAITGAGSGIGRALALQAGSRGARLALSDKTADAAADTLRAAGGAGFAFECNVRDDEQVRAFAAKCAENGGASVLFNNAGVSLSAFAEDTARDDFEWLMDINFWGVVRGTEAFLPQLRRAPHARLVNVSSIFGIMTVPSQSAYHASKFAVRGYSETLRQELRATQIRVCTVHPGGVRTNIVRGGRHYRGVDGNATDTDRTALMFERMARLDSMQAARIIWRGVDRGQPRILVGTDAVVLDALARLVPGHYDRVISWVERRFRG